MALLQNCFLNNQNPIRWMQGNFVGQSRMGWNKTDRLNQSIAFGKLASIPSGSYTPTAWVLPIRAGDMSARSELIGTGSAAGTNLIAGRNLGAGLTGSGDMAGTAQLIVSLTAALTGDGDITSALVLAILSAQANLSGQGSISATVRADATLGGTLTGSGVVASTIRATGTLGADITVTGSSLSTANVASAVWSAQAATNNTPGTMGGALAAAGAAGDPWSTALPAAYPPGTAGYMIGTELLRFASDVETGMDVQQAFRALVATLTGKATGGGGPSITFRDPADTVDRVTLTVDENGNRSNVTLNL